MVSNDLARLRRSRLTELARRPRSCDQLEHLAHNAYCNACAGKIRELAQFVVKRYIVIAPNHPVSKSAKAIMQ